MCKLYGRDWLKEHYIDKNLTAQECADIIGCSVKAFEARVRRANIRKCVDGKYIVKRKNNDPRKIRVRVRSKTTDRIIGIYESLKQAARENSVDVASAHKCLHGLRNSTGGLIFEEYRTHGEEVIHRKLSIKETDTIVDTVKHLHHRSIPPRMGYDEGIAYYKKKLNGVWKRLGYDI